jgi:hypothetical protein
MSKLTNAEKATIISEYEAAYARANPGESVQLTMTSPGWYTLNGYKKYRLPHYAAMTARLNERAAKAAERALKPKTWVVVAKAINAAEGKVDYYLDYDGGWVSKHYYDQARRYTEKLDAEWVAARKNNGLPYNYVVVEPSE